MRKLAAVLLTVVLLGLTATYARAQDTTPWTLANTSALVTLAPGGTATVGFVIAGPVGPFLYQRVLVRAVGPTLATFGITNPVAVPQLLKVLDSKGNQGNGIITIGNVDWNATFVASGAFPLTGSEPFNSSARLLALQPGAYTVQVGDRSGAGGTVLIEVYLNAQIVVDLNGPV